MADTDDATLAAPTTTAGAAPPGLASAAPMEGGTAGVAAPPDPPPAAPAPTSAPAARAAAAVVPTTDAPLDPLPDDVHWWPVFGSPTAAPLPLAVAVSGDRVVVGGDFTFGMAGMAAGTYQRVADWDGRGWRRMGDGVNGAVRAVCIVGTDVYLGGDFTAAGGVATAHLARWDGTAWSAVAGGVDHERHLEATVRALVTDGTTLWVGGSFTRAGDLPVASLAALDLATGTWSDAGGGVGLTWSDEPGAVHALALDGPALHVGGSFDLVGGPAGTATAALATLDTATGTWTAYGAGAGDDGLSGTVHALAVDAATGDLAVAGRFTTMADVGAWNLAVVRGGEVANVGDVSNLGGPYAPVYAVAFAGDGLHVGGEFTTAGGAEATCWARYDGTRWSRPGDGVESTVKALAPTPDGGVVVIGDFTISGTLRVGHGGIWTGTGWRTFGQGVTSDANAGGTVNAVLPDGAGAWVGGLFDQAGQLPVRSVARWDGAGWDDMGGGVGAAVSHGIVFALTRLGDHLYVAGRFATAGDVVAANIARWDGRTWSTLGEGLDGFAYAMAVLGGRLYVGGNFTRAGGVPASRLASWDPATERWSAVGNNPTYDDDIRALAVVGDRWLVVGGDFHRFFFRGLPVIEGLYGMALFDTEIERTDQPLSGYRYISGMSRYGGTGLVNALLVLGGDLYVGGSFDVAGLQVNGPRPSPGFPAANLAVWHLAEDRWEAPGAADDQVHALAEVDGDLVAGGRFATIGETAASGVARLDRVTGTWHPLGSGLGGGVLGLRHPLALAQSPEAGLWVGGEFPSAGAVPSANLALWTATRRGG